MKIGLLIAGSMPDPLQSRFPQYGDMYTQLLAGRGFSFAHYNARAGELPHDATECDGWIITGSEYGVYDNPDWIKPLASSVRDIVQSGAPVIGICFGHQLLADVMGGRVEKWSGGWSIGRVAYTTTTGQTFHAIAWHQDQITGLPPHTIRLASSTNCRNAMILTGNNALGIQPHPEFDADVVHKVLPQMESIPEDVKHQTLDKVDGDIDQSNLANLIDRFLRSNTRNPDTVTAMIGEVLVAS